MQPVTELASTPEGHPLLVLRGEEGVVSVEGWRDPESGLVVGMLTVHSPSPHTMRCASEECEFIGRCYPLFGDWPTNFTAAEYLVRGGKYVALAEQIAMNWYIVFLCPAGVLLLPIEYRPGEHQTMTVAPRQARGKSWFRSRGARPVEEGR